MIDADTILKTARELNIKAAIDIPTDVKRKIEHMRENETNTLSRYVLDKILENYDAAAQDRRPLEAGIQED